MRFRYYVVELLNFLASRLRCFSYVMVLTRLHEISLTRQPEINTLRELCICKWRLHARKVASLEGADVHPRRERGTYRPLYCLARHPFFVMWLFCIFPNNFSLSISHLHLPSWLQHLKGGQISRTPRQRSISETRTSLGMTRSLRS